MNMLTDTREKESCILFCLEVDYYIYILFFLITFILVRGLALSDLLMQCYMYIVALCAL